MRILFLLPLLLAATACEFRDIRAEQQQECRSLGGFYTVGEDPDDDACVVTTDNTPPREVILFDDRDTD